MLQTIPKTPSPPSSKLTKAEDANQAIEKRIASGTQINPFFLFDINEVEQLYREWMDALPNVTPFFAVKCNPDDKILQRLVNLGAGFDCATLAEVKQVLNLGVNPDRIIFANPCKVPHHIKYARDTGVKRMTFDNMDELDKVHEIYPESELVIRIATEDSMAHNPLSRKYGAKMDQVEGLLAKANQLKLNVVGVAFHVGSSCGDASAYNLAIKDARSVFDLAESSFGFRFKLLDIGGGIPGRNEPSGTNFKQISKAVTQGLADHFPNYPELEIISEPGRYLTYSACTLVSQVHSRRIQNTQKDSHMYYIGDGVYGSFGDLWIGYPKSVSRVIRIVASSENHPVNSVQVFECTESDQSQSDELYPSSIWGPTCASYDLVVPDQLLPKLELGDYLQFNNMGSYSTATSSSFNGVEKPEIHYINQY